MHKLSGGRLSAVGVLTVFALVASGAGCRSGGRSGSGGAARVAVSAAALSADVAEIIVTVSPGDGPGFTPFQAAMSNSPDGWSAFISGIPVGPGRLFEVAANNAAHQTLYSGSAKTDIVAGSPATVVIMLGGSATNPYQDNAPVIDFVVASQSAVPPSATVRLGISAHDPDPGDVVSFQWAANCGTFDDTTKTSVTWTAPAVAGRCQISATASDNRGASVTVYLAIDVAASTGDVLVKIGENASPVITAMTANVRFQDPYQGDLAVNAVDPDGDTLSFVWTSTCTAVSFGSPAAASTTFQNTDGSSACVVRVSVTDGKGGAVTGAITVPPREGFELGPVITHAVQPYVDLTDPNLAEPVQAGDAVPLELDAYDPQDGQLSFTWTASSGTFSGQTDVRTSPGKSNVVFHVPTPVPAGLKVTATVANAINESNSHDFFFKASAACTPSCTGRTCGPDGCGGTCAPGCTGTDTCNASGQCVAACTPS